MEENRDHDNEVGTRLGVKRVRHLEENCCPDISVQVTHLASQLPAISPSSIRIAKDRSASATASLGGRGSTKRMLHVFELHSPLV